MKPTLYAEDLNRRWDTDDAIEWMTLLARVLARRCPEYQHGETVVDMHEERCHECAGLMFLYPDPPDWWSTNNTNPEWRIGNWRHFIRQVWRVLGIVENT